jgi:hypothetical protein
VKALARRWGDVAASAAHPHNAPSYQLPPLPTPVPVAAPGPEIALSCRGCLDFFHRSHFYCVETRQDKLLNCWPCAKRLELNACALVGPQALFCKCRSTCVFCKCRSTCVRHLAMFRTIERVVCVPVPPSLSNDYNLHFHSVLLLSPCYAPPRAVLM